MYAAQEFCHYALVSWIEMLDQDEGHTGLDGQPLKQLPERL